MVEFGQMGETTSDFAQTLSDFLAAGMDAHDNFWGNMGIDLPDVPVHDELNPGVNISGWLVGADGSPLGDAYTGDVVTDHVDNGPTDHPPTYEEGKRPIFPTWSGDAVTDGLGDVKATDQLSDVLAVPDVVTDGLGDKATDQLWPPAVPDVVTEPNPGMQANFDFEAPADANCEEQQNCEAMDYYFPNGDTIVTNGDTVATNGDTVATNGDTVATNGDTVATNTIAHDTVATNEDNGHQDFIIDEEDFMVMTDHEKETFTIDGAEYMERLQEGKEANENTDRTAEDLKKQANQRGRRADKLKDKAETLRSDGYDETNTSKKPLAKKIEQLEWKAAQKYQQQGWIDMIFEYDEYLSDQAEANLANTDWEAAKIAQDEATDRLAEAETRVEGLGDTDRAETEFLAAETDADYARENVKYRTVEASKARDKASLAEEKAIKSLDEAHTAETDLFGGETFRENLAEADWYKPPERPTYHRGDHRRLQTMERLLREIQLS